MNDNSAIDFRLSIHLMLNFPLEAARVMEHFSPQDTAFALGNIDSSRAAKILSLMDARLAAAALLKWPPDKIALILKSLSSAVTAKLLRLLSPASRNSLLDCCEEGITMPVRKMLQHAEGTAGALMEPDIFSIFDDFIVSQARKHIAKVEGSISDYVYVTNRSGILLGVSGFRELLRAPLTFSISQIMHKPVASIPAQTGRLAILTNPGWQNYHSLPVVSPVGELLGVISYRALRNMEHSNELIPATTPLFMAIGDMYWSMLSKLTENLIGSSQQNGENSEDVL